MSEIVKDKCYIIEDTVHYCHNGWWCVMRIGADDENV